MKKKIILTLIAALTISSLHAYPGQKIVEKYENKVYFLAGYISGAVSGTLLLARWLKNKYQQKKDIKSTAADKIKGFIKDVMGS